MRTIAFDFDCPFSEEAYKPLFEQLEQLDDVSVLVNNVGANYATKEDYCANSEENLMSTVHVNVNPATFLTWFFLPRMLKRDTKSAVVSVSAYGPNVFVQSVFGASKLLFHPDFLGKQYVWSLSDNCGFLHGKKVDFVTVFPGFTESASMRAKDLGIDADDHAKACIATWGHDRESYGHWVHALVSSFSFRNNFIKWTLNEHNKDIGTQV